MMKKILLVVFLLAGVAAFVAANYHFVLLDESVRILKKTNVTFESTFVDARGIAKKARLLLEPALISAGIKDLFEGGGVTIGK